MPTTRQSTVSITQNMFTTDSLPTINPRTMSTTAGASVESRGNTFTEPGAPHYDWVGAWISPPLAAQTISGSFTVQLDYQEGSTNQNMFPGILVYVWKADNSGVRGTLRTELFETTEANTTFGTLQILFASTTITSLAVSAGDRIVVELLAFDNNTKTVDYAHYFSCNGAVSSGSESYIYFSMDIAWFTGTTQTVTDTITLTDLPKVHKTLKIADTIGLADAIRVSKRLVIGDSIHLGDAYFVHKTVSLLDAITLFDTVNVTTIVPPTNVYVTDVINLVDTLRVHKGLTLSEAIVLTDAVLRHKQFTLPDGLTVTDVVTKAGANRLSDSAGVFDSAYVHKALKLTESVGVFDSVLVHKTIRVYDSFGAADSILTHKTFHITDSFGVLDSVLTHKHLMVVDTLGAADVPRTHKTLKFAEVMSLLDAITAGPTGSTKDVDDLVGLTEQLLIHKTLKITDTLGLLDSVKVHKTIRVYDSLGEADSVLTHKHFIITDSLGAADAIPVLMKNLSITDVISLLDEVTVTSSGSYVEIDDVVGLLENILIHKHFIITDTLHITDSVVVIKPSTIDSRWGLRGMVGQLIQQKYRLGITPLVYWDEEQREAQAFTPLIKVLMPTATADMIGVGYGHMKVKHRLVIDVKGRDANGVYNAVQEVLRVLGAYRLAPFTGYTMFEYNDGTQMAGYSGFYWWTIDLTVWQVRRPVELGD